MQFEPDERCKRLRRLFYGWPTLIMTLSYMAWFVYCALDMAVQPSPPRASPEELVSRRVYALVVPPMALMAMSVTIYTGWLGWKSFCHG